MADFEGKVVIVTGAAGGIGRASAVAFAGEGARVVVADLNEAGANETASMIGEKARSVIFDVADPAACEALVADTVAHYGRLDVLFNNAGIAGETSYTESQTLDNWQRVIDINLSGVFYCAKYAIGAMRESGGGVIINTSSIDGYNGMSALGPYTAAKHGVIGLTKTVALEYGRENIRCVAVCPGFIDTAMTKHGLSEESRALLAQAIPNPGGVAAQPEQVAQMVIWLASDKASYVNGSAHVVDAGITAGFSLPENA